MRTYQKYLFPLLFLIPSTSVFAGFMEVGASGNYRISKINSNNYQEMVSYTGSLSYYFWEMSAMELSYTQGNQIVVLQIPSDNKTTTTTFFELIGLDLVITLADKQSDFQPYVKMGGAYIKKEIVRTIESLGSDRIDSPAGLVPSAGVGFRIKLSTNFSIKAGVDAWTSPLKQNPVTIDYAGRAGVSFLF
ncbi:MAG: porin family protein [Bdellovibrionales bacterium]|nr:porin family protein [Bdellovibrionales bacterium]